MHLEHKTEAYVRKAMRQVRVVRAPDGQWIASAPAFGIQVSGSNDRDAVSNLAFVLRAYVLFAREHSRELPVIEDVNLNRFRDSETIAVDELAKYAKRQYQSGNTIALEDFARENDIALDVD